MNFNSFLFLVILFLAACSNSETATKKTDAPWQGSWLMVGYDEVSVANRDTLVIMQLNEKNEIEYITQTRSGKILMQNSGEYSINDQHSVLTIMENGQSQIEYFIRKVDQDSLIFQSDTFSIKWKRIE